MATKKQASRNKVKSTVIGNDVDNLKVIGSVKLKKSMLKNFDTFFEAVGEMDVQKVAVSPKTYKTLLTNERASVRKLNRHMPTQSFDTAFGMHMLKFSPVEVSFLSDDYALVIE